MKTSLFGFSFLELSITLSIISITVLIALPSWQYFYKNIEVKTLTHQLQSTFTIARNQAIIQKTPILIMPIDQNWQNGWKIMIEKRNECLSIYPPPPKSLKLSLVVFRHSNEIRIMPDGTLNGSNGHFSYDDTSLYFNRGGRLHLTKVAQ